MSRAGRWKRFSIRSLFVFVVIVAMFLAWMAARMQTVRRQRLASAKLESLGATVMNYHFTIGPKGQLTADRDSSPGPSAIKAVFGDDIFSDVIEVNASYTSISGSDLVALRSFRKLEYLSLDDLPIGDNDLQVLTELTGLRHLSLNNTIVSDRGLQVIGTLTNLTFLEISNTQVSDNGLKYLESLTQLEHLVLDNCRIRGPGLASLRGFKKLAWLDLSNTEVTDEFIKDLHALSSLEKVFLIDTPITKDSVNSLKLAIPQADIWEPDWEYCR